MTAQQKIQEGRGPLVIGKKASDRAKAQTVEERLAAMEADLSEIKLLLKKALGK